MEIELDEILGERGKALGVVVEGTTFYVGKSIVDNLDELLEQQKLDPEDQEDPLLLRIPRWCAHQNGWLDDEE